MVVWLLADESVTVKLAVGLFWLRVMLLTDSPGAGVLGSKVAVTAPPLAVAPVALEIAMMGLSGGPN